MQRADGWLPEMRVGVWVKWVKGVKRYKLLVIKQISPPDVMYNIVTMVNKTVLYI